MALHLFGAKPLSEPMMTYGQLEHWEEILLKYISKFKQIQGNAFKQVIYKIVSSLSHTQCVNVIAPSNIVANDDTR